MIPFRAIQFTLLWARYSTLAQCNVLAACTTRYEVWKYGHPVTLPGGGVYWPQVTPILIRKSAKAGEVFPPVFLFSSYEKIRAISRTSN
jgi:hypothetical protein